MKIMTVVAGLLLSASAGAANISLVSSDSALVQLVTNNPMAAIAASHKAKVATDFGVELNGLAAVAQPLWQTKFEQITASTNSDAASEKELREGKLFMENFFAITPGWFATDQTEITPEINTAASTDFGVPDPSDAASEKELREGKLLMENFFAKTANFNRAEFEELNKQGFWKTTPFKASGMGWIATGQTDFQGG